MTVRYALRALLFVMSAAVGAGLFMLALHHGSGLQLAGITGFGATAPMIGIALAFPALYLLWEQSEM